VDQAILNELRKENNMDDFLKVIKGIDWEQLHRQKHQILQVIDDAEKIFGSHDNELMGVVNLIDSLQYVASKLRIWTFPSERFDGECPECKGRNYEFLEETFNGVNYECYDCGKIFTIKTIEKGWWKLKIGGQVLYAKEKREYNVEVLNCEGDTVHFYSHKSGRHFKWSIDNFLRDYIKDTK
jgi:hypothetical protein